MEHVVTATIVASWMIVGCRGEATHGPGAPEAGAAMAGDHRYSPDAAIGGSADGSASGPACIAPPCAPAPGAPEEDAALGPAEPSPPHHPVPPPDPAQETPTPTPSNPAPDGPPPPEPTVHPSEPFDSDPLPPFTPGPIDGTFVFFGSSAADARIPTASIPRFLDELRSLGMSTVIVHSTRVKLGACDRGSFQFRHELPAKLDVLLDAAARRSMRVYVGLSSSSDACPTFHQSPNREHVIDDVRAIIGSLSAQIDHEAFAGWYIPDEPGLGWSTMYAYYRGIVDVIRTVSQAPILVSPYLVGVTHSPAEVAEMAAAFQVATGVSIQVWQDSVGADAIALASGRGHTVEEYFTAIAARLGPDHLWSDNELFNYGPLGAYWDGAPYSPASVQRLNQQLWQTRPGITSKRVVWLAQVHMGTIDPYRLPGATRLYHAYRALYGLAGSYLTPTGYRGYSFGTAPASLYPDASGAELFDRQMGDPKRFTHEGWSGVLGTAVIDVSLAAGTPVSWVAVHVLNEPSAGIRIPDALTLRCDGAPVGTWARPFSLRANDREYVLSNATPLAARCGRLTVELPNSQWTFLSEIEIVGDQAATPTPATPATVPAPTVVLVVHGVEYRGGPDLVTHPTRSIPAAHGTYSVALYADGPLSPHHVCRLDRSGVEGVLWSAGEWRQLDHQGGPGGPTEAAYCAYCYVRPESLGSVAYSQTGACITVTH